MAVVYKAEDVKLNRFAALELLPEKWPNFLRLWAESSAKPKPLEL